MIFYLIGIDYKTVSLEEIEVAHRLRREIVNYWHRVNPGKAAVLATCNRVEIYGIASNIHEAVALERSFKHTFKNCFEDAYVAYGYDNVFEHGVRLASGLKSQLRGERQIMQQLEKWRACDNFPIFLRNIWGRIIKNAKEIRALSGLDKNTIDIAELVLDDLERNAIYKKSTEILVIGTGKIATLIAEKNLQSAHLIFVARKKLSRAKELAAICGAEALLRDELPQRLLEVDAIISATNSPHYVLTLSDFSLALKSRRRPLYIYDVAVPRDVAPEIYTVPFTRIKVLEDLSLAFYERKTYLSGRLQHAEKLIEENVLQHKERNSVKEDANRYTTQPACA